MFSERDVLVVYLPQQTGQLLFVPPVPATTPGESGVVTAIQSVQPQYHWRELPQVCFVSTKVLSRQNASSVVTKVCRTRQNFCRDKIMFVAICVLSTHICCDKHVFVATKASMSQTKRLPRQTHFCCDKTLVATGLHLSRQNTGFVATKMILVAAPANDTPGHTLTNSLYGIETIKIKNNKAMYKCVMANTSTTGKHAAHTSYHLAV